jgi:hypothetical protein
MLRTLVAAAMVLATTEAEAGRFRAEEMLSNCTPIEQAEAGDGKTWYTPTYEAGLCVGFLGGIWSATGIVSDNSDPQHSSVLHVCQQAGVSVKQLAAIFDTYVRAHAEAYQEDALFPALNSLSAAFPCQPKAQ